MYLEIAKETLKEMACITLANDGDTRIFETRQGYSTVFMDLFGNVTQVTIDGNVVTNYEKRQWDRRNGRWYNSLVFNERFHDEVEVEVTANWLTDATAPPDLQLVLAGLFDLISKKNKFDGTLQSKQVEDFRLTFNSDADLDEIFSRKYGVTLQKYSLCNVGAMRSGSVNGTRR